MKTLTKLIRKIAAMTALVLGLSFLPGTTVLADGMVPVNFPSTEARWKVLIEGDDIQIHNYDRQRTSMISYQTLGFTISRCKMGIGDPNTLARKNIY